MTVSDAEERADLLRQIRRIEIRTAALADGSCAGPYRSPLRGSGMALANLREYLPGDDARTIDWKASARLDRLFVREYEEERNQTYYLVLDRSGSAAFGSSTSKDRRILEVAASLIFAAHRQNGRVGLCIATDRVERVYPGPCGQEPGHQAGAGPRYAPILRGRAPTSPPPSGFSARGSGADVRSSSSPTSTTPGSPGIWHTCGGGMRPLPSG